MLKLVNKTAVLTLLCLIFIGQSVASSVMFYDMASMNDMRMQEHNMMSMMDHSNMQAVDSDAQASDSALIDCCLQQCQCLASGCSTMATLSPLGGTFPIIDNSLKILFDNKLIAIQALASLYRPPILS